MGLEDAYTVVVVVDDPERDAALVRLACDLVGREEPGAGRGQPRRPADDAEAGGGQRGLTADLALLAEAGDELRQLSRVVDEREVCGRRSRPGSATHRGPTSRRSQPAPTPTWSWCAPGGASPMPRRARTRGRRASRGPSSWSPGTSANSVWRRPARSPSSRTRAPTGAPAPPAGGPGRRRPLGPAAAGGRRRLAGRTAGCRDRRVAAQGRRRRRPRGLRGDGRYCSSPRPARWTARTGPAPHTRISTVHAGPADRDRDLDETLAGAPPPPPVRPDRRLIMAPEPPFRRHRWSGRHDRARR